MRKIIEVNDLFKTYVVNKKQNNVLRNVNFSIEEGEMVGIMGPSGSGKSTLLYTVSGMDKMTAGEVAFNGRNLSGLSENALKYGDGRRITVECGSEEDSVLVTVSNTGCTLPEHELEHIFESFYRGSNVGNKNGSGLGLYICKKLMNLMKGGLFAEINGDEMKVTAVCRCC